MQKEPSPTLRTLIMVEKTLQKVDSLIKVSELKRILPRKVNHYNLLPILNYLQKNNKIYVSVKGIIWIENKSKKLEKAIREGYEH